MFIRGMSEKECIALVSARRLARLACSKDSQPYVVPIYYAYSGKCLYAFSMPERKIEWMRANPHVCVQVDDISDRQQWRSMVMYGRYQELPDTARWYRECLHAPGPFSRSMSTGGSREP